MVQLGQETGALLDKLGVDRALWNDGSMPSVTPLTGEQLGMVRVVDSAAIDERLDAATAAFRAWRHVPAPRPGALVRLWGVEFLSAKGALAKLVKIETGLISSACAVDELENTDIIALAARISRQIHGPPNPPRGSGHCTV